MKTVLIFLLVQFFSAAVWAAPIHKLVWANSDAEVHPQTGRVVPKEDLEYEISQIIVDESEPNIVKIKPSRWDHWIRISFLSAASAIEFKSFLDKSKQPMEVVFDARGRDVRFEEGFVSMPAEEVQVYPVKGAAQAAAHRVIREGRAESTVDPKTGSLMPMAKSQQFKTISGVRFFKENVLMVSAEHSSYSHEALFIEFANRKEALFAKKLLEGPFALRLKYNLYDPKVVLSRDGQIFSMPSKSIELSAADAEGGECVKFLSKLNSPRGSQSEIVELVKPAAVESANGAEKVSKLKQIWQKIFKSNEIKP